MQTNRKTSIYLDIPFYRQHYDFTCGPASLMMAMKYFNTLLHLSKELEIDLWREGNLVGLWGTSRFGLAFSAAVRGFHAKITSNTGGIDFVEWAVPPLPDPDMQMLRDHFYERKARCKKLGVRERLEPITGETLYNALSLNHTPLIVTNTSLFGEDNLPHWIVGTGIDSHFMYYNNPLDKKATKRKIKLFKLDEFIGYHGDQSMVEIWRH